MKSKKNKKPEEPSSYEFSDQPTRDKIEKHLHDINDTISDEDIKKVKIPGVDQSSKSPKKDKDKNVLEGKTIKEEIDSNTKKNDQITPWDILDE